LILLTFDARPAIQFSSLPAAQAKLHAQTPAAGKPGTPTSTPSATVATHSPEAPDSLLVTTPIPPPTPTTLGVASALDQGSPSQNTTGFETSPDPDATLMDPTDECWTAVLPFGFSSSVSPSSAHQPSPALQSGFLLRRHGHGQGHGTGTGAGSVVGLGVNLILAPTTTSTAAAAATTTTPPARVPPPPPPPNGTNPGLHPRLLRQILTQWRALYTLARTRGAEYQSGTLGFGGSDAADEAVPLPWHIRTALKGSTVLSGVGAF
jgi:hypothetical protein